MRGPDPDLPADSAAIIQQAKNPPPDDRFVQIVAKQRRRRRAKVKAKPKLTRVAFRISRMMEFCIKRELQNQTGHATDQWPLVVFKELVDNALDACEETEIPPVISIAVTPASFTITDNGAGIKPCKDSDAEAVGITIIESRGVRHRIKFEVDHINNQPRITHTTAPSPIDAGTKITVRWPKTKTYCDETLLTECRDEIEELAEAYIWFNPHLTLRGTWSGKEFINVAATNPRWDKWRPRDPTSAHWYDETRLQRYLAAHVARDRDLKRQRTVREFISEFRGLSRSAVQRKVLDEVGCSHVSLAAFFGLEKVNRAGIAKLLASMRKHTRPVASKHLGIIGEDHLKARFLAAGGNAETFKYEQRKGIDKDGLPYVVEFAFGLHQSGLTESGAVSRKIVTGANWSAAIGNPFRSFGATGEGLESTLAKVRANAREPVICALHLTHARIQFADRGKSSIILTDDGEQPDD